MNLYYANVTIHVLAALFWLGGMFFLGLVGAPVLRSVEPPALRAKLFASLGERFRSSGWTAIGILVVTGLINLNFRGFLGPALLDPEFWGTRYGVALGWKLATVVAMITISAIHDFVLGPAAGRMDPGSPEALVARRRAAVLARVNAIIGILLVVAAVRLARGG
jgi:putative copper resistance protein D